MKKVCPLKFNMPKDSVIPNYDCEEGQCAWWTALSDDDNTRAQEQRKAYGRGICALIGIFLEL